MNKPSIDLRYSVSNIRQTGWLFRSHVLLVLFMHFLKTADILVYAALRVKMLAYSVVLNCVMEEQLMGYSIRTRWYNSVR